MTFTRYVLLLAALLVTMTAGADTATKKKRKKRRKARTERTIKDPMSVVNTAADSLIFPAGISADFRQLARDLNALRAGNPRHINMLHIGASHVQAGIFTHRVRTRLSNAFAPNHGSRGCIFPFATIKSTSPKSYSLEHTGRWHGARNIKNPDSLPLGVMGATATTSDPNATLSLTLNTDSQSVAYRIDTLTILGEASSPQAYPIVIANGDTIRPTDYHLFTLALTPGTLPQPLPIADSTSPQAPSHYTYPLPTSATACDICFPGVSDSASFTLRGIITKSATPGITYTAAGISGAAVPSWLSCELLPGELSLFPPRLVIFAIGINDASVRHFSPDDFKQNYRQLIGRIRQASPDCCFIFVTNNDCYLNLTRRGRFINPNTAAARQVFYELAHETQGAVFDVFDIMGGEGSSKQWVKAGLMNRDHVHFTADGYNLIGDMLFEAIWKTLNF